MALDLVCTVFGNYNRDSSVRIGGFNKKEYFSTEGRGLEVY